MIDLARLAIGTTIGGTLLGMVGEWQSGQSAAAQYAYQAQAARITAALTDRRGIEAAHQARIRGRQLVGAQRAAWGSSGIDVNVGSPLDVQVETAQLAELDALQIRHNARLEAYQLRTSGRLNDAAAGDARRAGTIAAGATLLGGAASALDQGYRYRYMRNRYMPSGG